VSPPSPKGRAEKRTIQYAKVKLKMKRTMKWLKLSLIVAFVAVMLTSSLQAVSASSTSKNALPDFLVRYAQNLSKGNSTELAIIENEMITQQQIKQDRITSTNGAVLNFSPSTNQLSSASPDSNPTYSWMTSVTATSVDTIDTQTGATVGEIRNANRLTGQPDGSYAWLFTDGWNENTNNPIGGEAFAFGTMYNSWAQGDIYVYAYTPNTAWQNYVMISASTDGTHWTYIGYAAVTSTSAGWVYIGYSSSVFSYIAVECWTPPPYPTYYAPLVCNNVYIDSVMTASG
jgi:hypothetical protein